MPVYEYKHVNEACAAGQVIEVEQAMSDEPLRACPRCGKAVRKIISRTFVATPTSDSDLKAKGFTKLVKRDEGVYENVTRSGKESRYMESGKPETMPKLKGKISD